jgi:hypothetical protein
MTTATPVQNCAMAADLTPVVAALAELDDRELAALIDTTNTVPQTAPGLLAWIEHAADRELNRRRGFDFPLRPPEAAIPPEEDAVSFDAAVIIRARFAQEGREETCGVVGLFDAIIRLLTGSGHRH